MRPTETTRRDFVRLGGAAMALAGMTGCGRPPEEKIVPYNEAPPELIPGIAQYYATSMVLDGYATGLLVASREGRPVKIEGNPDHPASLGGTGVHEQASVLDLYDPDRIPSCRRRGAPVSWQRVVGALEDVADDGRGLRFLLEPTSSPTTSELLDRIRERYPQARIAFQRPTFGTPELEAGRALHGRALQPIYDFTAADRVVVLDADVLVGMPFHLRYSRQFADRRRVRSLSGDMPRLYVAEPKPTPTGTLADHRLAIQASFVPLLAAGLLRRILGADALPGDVRQLVDGTPLPAEAARWVDAAARDLLQNPGRSVVLTGPRQPWEVHAIAQMLNARLGNLGRTVLLVDSPLYAAGEAEISVEQLVGEIRSGQARHLVIASFDPVYALSSELRFGEALQSAPDLVSIYLADHFDQTAALCEWIVPRLHFLESWGDARAYDGTVSFVQPLVAPLRAGKTVDQMLAAFLDAPLVSDHRLLRDHWGRRWGADLDVALEAALRQGFLPGSASPISTSEPRELESSALMTLLDHAGSELMEASFFLDPAMHDGRFSANPWLQELPEPQTKLTWGNAVLMGPSLMRELGIQSGRVVDVAVDDETITGVALLLPGMAPKTIGLHLGHGRSVGPGGATFGFDVHRLRPTRHTAFVSGVTVNVRNEEESLARTQEHYRMHGREIAIRATLAELRRHPDIVAHLRGPVEHLFFPPQEVHSPQWGMVIDQTVCHGCSACVIACQAENNIPVVGRAGVLDGREMHWLRIDRYYEGDLEDPAFLDQPMLCQHCERAPCEYVCPVNATVHDPDGLNNMIYNRCIGTRFCSNNCPWKVRRFNWFDYVDRTSRTMQKNPDVTVRERGVMEKCTYCVQRIRRAEIEARRDGAPVSGIRVETACQQACPTRAISFGDLTDPRSEVSAWWNRPHRYAVLHETGAQPRTQYLVKLDNPVEEEA